MTTWYRDGLISLTAGSDLVAGVGTEWVDNVLPGGIFFTPTGLVEVERVISDGSLKLVSAYAGPTVAGAEYAIAPTQGYVTALSKEVNALLGTFGELKDAWQDGTLVGKGVALKGVKNSVGDLPATGNAAGDAWMVDGHLHVWSGTTWLDQGNAVATSELEALRDAAVSAAGTSKDFEDRVYPGVYSSPPSNRPHSGLPSQDGDRAVIIALGQPREHIRAGGGWLIPNLDMTALADAGGAMLVGGTTPIYTIKDFRKAGGTDSEIINRALRKIEADALPGSRLIFECGRTYIYDSTHSLGYINDLDIDLNGALLKRADSAATVSTLSADVVTSGIPGRTLVLNAIPANWAVADTVAAVLGPNDQQTSSVRRITAINRGTNTVTLNSALSDFSMPATLPSGTVIAKSFNCFAGRPSANDSSTLLTQGVNKRIRLHSGRIDGNGVNQVSNSWRFSSEIILHSLGGEIFSMDIRNTTAECIVGHGWAVTASVFEDLAGSAIHTSANDATLADIGPSFFKFNSVRRTNLKGQVASGHAEAAVTFSWSPGMLVVSNNVFDQGSEAILGNFGVSTGANASKLLIVTGNICRGYPKIFASAAGSTYGVTLTGNAFHDCGDNSALTTTFFNRLNRISGNSISGNTVLPEQAQLVAQRFGPVVIETVGGAGPAVATNPNNRLWLKQSGSGIAAENLADSNVVLESSGDNLFSFAGIATKISGFVWRILGSANAIAAYVIHVPAENTFKMGINSPAGHTMLKSGNFSDHLKLDGNGDTVFLKRTRAIYIGDQNTDGSWMIDASGTNLIFRRRVGGSWDVKQTILG